MSINYSKQTTSLIEVSSGRTSTAQLASQADTLTYEPYFGLNEKPFSLNADARFVYDSSTHGATRRGLLAAIRRREGLLVLTGEIGAGKTTLCRSVLRDLGRNTYSSLVPDPFATREDLLKMLLVDFGVVSIPELTSGRLRQASRTELGFVLSEFLDSLAPDAFAVVVIDEAQNLSLPLIEETRILFDAYAAKGRMQIVFSGQPELHAKLKLPEMRQVDQRVCGYHRLAPMTRDAVMGYIQHRLHAAGADRDCQLFPQEVVDALHKRSGGVPRLINRICDRALQLAYESKSQAVTQEILDTALIEVGAVTLAPTWDSIMFGDERAATAAVPAAAAPTAVVAPAAVVAPVAPVTPVAPVAADEDVDFEKQIDNWVRQDLAPPSRTLTPLAEVFNDAPIAPRATPRTAAKTTAKTASKRPAPARSVTTDWPHDVRSETYMQKFLRMWTRRAAIAIAAFIALNLLIAGASVAMAGLSPATPPSLPQAPVKAVTPLAAPEAPAAEAPSADAASPAQITSETAAVEPVTAAPTIVASAAAPSGDFLVAVGLFADRGRADQLVEALTQAGLPAMQRPFRMRRGEVQQVVLGPFFSRADAAADLRRLQALGGYDDASVITQ